jgi:hypothetical protein
LFFHCQHVFIYLFYRTCASLDGAKMRREKEGSHDGETIRREAKMSQVNALQERDTAVEKLQAAEHRLADIVSILNIYNH